MREFSHEIIKLHAKFAWSMQMCSNNKLADMINCVRNEQRKCIYFLPFSVHLFNIARISIFWVLFRMHTDNVCKNGKKEEKQCTLHGVSLFYFIFEFMLRSARLELSECIVIDSSRNCWRKCRIKSSINVMLKHVNRDQRILFASWHHICRLYKITMILKAF